LPALSRMAASPASPIAPATATPFGAKSPDCTAAVKTSILPPLPLPFHAACRRLPPIVIGSVGTPVTTTFSVNVTENASVAPAA